MGQAICQFFVFAFPQQSIPRADLPSVSVAVPGRISEEEGGGSLDKDDEELLLRIAAQNAMQENLNKMMPIETSNTTVTKRKYLKLVNIS